MFRPGDLINPFAPATGAPPRQLWPFFRWALAGAWPVLILAGLVSGMAGSAEVLAAFVLGELIDIAQTAGPEGVFQGRSLWTLAAGAGFFLILRPALLLASATASGIVVGPNVQPLVLARLFRWTNGHALSFFESDFAGRIAQKQMQTARALTDVVVECINTGLFALTTLLGAALMLGAINPLLILPLLIWVSGYVLMLRWFIPRIRSRSKKRANTRAAVTGQVVDTITNIKTVKLFGNTAQEDEAAIHEMQRYRGDALSFGRMSTAFRVCLITWAGALPVSLVGLTLVFWQVDHASTGDIAAVGTLSIRLAQMTGWVSFTLMAIYANLGEIEDGMRTLTPPQALTDAPDAQPFQPGGGRIEFEDVSFAYGQESGGVRGISLSIAPGEKLGIVGASGAGKSTLVALLLRLYDAESGRILVDGQDLRALTQTSLRRAIAMVTQDGEMFNRSALENIRYGAPDASEADVVAAAKTAQAHDFIQDLKDGRQRGGYSAFLGERGVKLSGGQRQRIALARALLKKAQILVLDEATSALDSEVEAEIQQSLSHAMEGKTVLAIAHRLSTLAEMDRIIVLDQGRIVEEGPHAELLSQGGLYARYWERQSGGFLDPQTP